MSKGGHTFNFNGPVGTINASAGDMILVGRNEAQSMEFISRLEAVLRSLEEISTLDMVTRATVERELNNTKEVLGVGNSSPAFLQQSLDTAAKALESAAGVGEKGMKLAKVIKEILAWSGLLVG